jgi:NADPH-dependent ferric siderophore reductase
MYHDISLLVMTTATPHPRPVPDDLFGGRLKDCFLLDLTVLTVVDLAPWLRSITFASPDLVGFTWLPGQDLMLEVPAADGVTTRRRYSIRRSHAGSGTLDIEVVLHGSGPFARWADRAAPGDQISGIGPRGAITLRADAAHHLLVGDETAIPVTAAMLEGVGPDASATAVIGVTAEPPAYPSLGRAPITWVRADELVDHVRATPLPDGTAAYLNGEWSLVRELNQLLMSRGVAAEAIATKAYWRRDQPNAAHGEPGRD